MEKINIEREPVAPTKFKLEVTKNSKGYNYVVRVYGDDIPEIQNDMVTLQEWAEEKYGNK